MRRLPPVDHPFHCWAIPRAIPYGCCQFCTLLIVADHAAQSVIPAPPRGVSLSMYPGVYPSLCTQEVYTTLCTQEVYTTLCTQVYTTLCTQVYTTLYTTRVYLLCTTRVYHPIHPGYTTMCYRSWSYSAVSTRCYVAGRRGPGLKDEETPGWEPLRDLRFS